MREQIVTIGSTSCYMLDPYEKGLLRLLSDEEFREMTEEMEENGCRIDGGVIVIMDNSPQTPMRKLRIAQSVIYKHCAKKEGSYLYCQTDKERK